MIENTYKNIGVFGNTYAQTVDKMIEMYYGLEKANILRFAVGKTDCKILMKDGTCYTGLTMSTNARGFKFSQVYVPFDIDIEIFNKVILPLVGISNLPREERVIEY